MSRLPGAPLIEVIFELRWTTLDPSDQYLQGDLFPLIKDKYPHREAIGFAGGGFPPGSFIIGGPTHRFRAAANDYPLVQIGPGVLTVNTVDAKYSWKDFENSIIEVYKKFIEVYPLKDTHNVKLTLQYIDLIRFDFDKGDILKFLNDKLHTSINQSFYSGSQAKNAILALNFENELGSLNISFARGKNFNQEDGIALQTNLTSGTIRPETSFISDWLSKAHIMTSSLFKEMTKGDLQKEFASKN